MILQMSLGYNNWIYRYQYQSPSKINMQVIQDGVGMIAGAMVIVSRCKWHTWNIVSMDLIYCILKIK